MEAVLKKLLPPPIIVAGMHRSGTTFFSQSMIKKGIFMGKKLDPNAESMPLIQYNEEVLKANALDWDCVGDVKVFPAFKSRYFIAHFFSKNFLNGFVDIYQAIKQNNLWGWKDPRNTINILYWLSIFPKAKIVFIYRNGYDVAKSLEKRNNKLNKKNRHFSKKLTNIESSFKLWEEYNAHFYKLMDLIPKDQLLIVCYEDLLNKDEAVLLNIDNFIQQGISKTLLHEVEENKLTSKIHDYPEFVRKSYWMQKLGYISS